jgi:hypothetical protein
VPPNLLKISNYPLAEIFPVTSLSLQTAWDRAFPSPPGILDQIERDPSRSDQRITCSLFLQVQGRLVCGLQNGQIILVTATHTIMFELLAGQHHDIDGEFLNLIISASCIDL